MAQEYTTEQLRGMGINPDETTSPQTIGGKVYKLENTGRGTRYLNELGSQSQVATQGAISDLNTRYDKLISSLKTSGEQAAERQTAITSAELGQRGILGGSTLAQQDIERAANQARQPFIQAASEADINRANAILGAQTSLAGLQEGARQFDITSALKKSELEFAQRPQLPKYLTVGGEGGYIIDPQTGNIVRTLQKLTGGGGGGVSNYYSSGEPRYELIA